MLYEHFKNGQNFVTMCQSGVISPNLVTLVTAKFEIIRRIKLLAVRQQHMLIS